MNSKWGSNWQAVQFLSLYTLKNLYFEGHLSILHISEKPSTWPLTRPQTPLMTGLVFSLRALLFFQFQIATVTEKGVEIEGPLSAETNWDIAHMIRWLKLKLQWNNSWEIPGCSKVGFSGGLNQKFSGWQGFGLKIELFWGTDFSLYGFMILSSLFLVALNEIHYPELKLYPSSNFELGWFKGTILL